VERTNHVFQQAQAEQDPKKLNTFMEEKKKELEVLKRAAAVNQMYGGRKLVIEADEEFAVPPKFERSDH
jgi:LYR motif-containing protein 4